MMYHGSPRPLHTVAGSPDALALLQSGATAPTKAVDRSTDPWTLAAPWSTGAT